MAKRKMQSDMTNSGTSMNIKRATTYNEVTCTFLYCGMEFLIQSIKLKRVPRDTIDFETIPDFRDFESRVRRDIKLVEQVLGEIVPSE